MYGRAERMKVALVVGQFPAVSETFVLNHVTGLLDRGVDVSILALRCPDDRVRHADVAEYGLIERTRYAQALPPSSWQRRAAVAGLLAHAARHAPRTAVPLRRWLATARHDANVALDFRALAGDGRLDFDVVHCHFGPHGQLGLALRALGLLRGRLVTTFHGYDMSRTVQHDGAGLYARLFREGDLFLPISDHWRRRLVEIGAPSDRTVVHRMGVDVRRFTYRASRPRAAGEPLALLSVARLTEKKGLEYAIRAVARLRGEGVAVRHTIVGEGPLRPALERLVADLGIGDAVRLLGALDGSAVAEHMARAHALVAPSVTAADGNQEGLPVVLMEALASGLPAVSTRHTGIPELVEHDVTGLLTDERDVDGLTRELRRLADDPALGARLAAAGRARVCRDHDVETLNDRLVERYRELLARPAATRLAS